MFNVKDIKIVVYHIQPKSLQGYLAALLAAATFGGVAPKAGEYVFEQVKANVLAAVQRKVPVDIAFEERWRGVAAAFGRNYGTQPRTCSAHEVRWPPSEGANPNTPYGMLYGVSQLSVLPAACN